MPSYPLRTGDSPTPLRSTNEDPVEASLDDMNLLQMDALPASHGASSPPAPFSLGSPLNLEQKLQQEFNYHKHGSYLTEQQNLPSYNNNNNPGVSLPAHRFVPDMPQQVSSVQSWLKPSPYANPASELGLRSSTSDEALHMPHYDSHMSLPNSQYGPYHQPKPGLERAYSYQDQTLDGQAMKYPLPESGSGTCMHLRYQHLFTYNTLLFTLYSLSK